ncbi:MAG: YciI family protein [Rhizomicrobium sp.]
MRFMMLMIPDVYKRPVPEDFVPPADAVAEMGKFNAAMEQAGILRTAEGLTPPIFATRVSFQGGTPLVTDGPFAETKEVLGGYWIIEVESQDVAVRWAVQCPAAQGDVIEVRRIFGPEDFSS